MRSLSIDRKGVYSNNVNLDIYDSVQTGDTMVNKSFSNCLNSKLTCQLMSIARLCVVITTIGPIWLPVFKTLFLHFSLHCYNVSFGF